MEALKIYKQSGDFYMVVEDATEDLINTISNAGMDISLYKDGERYIVVIKDCEKSLNQLILFGLNYMTKKGKAVVDTKTITNVEPLTEKEELPDIDTMENIKTSKGIDEILSTPYSKLNEDDLISVFKNKKAQHITGAILQQTGHKTVEEFTESSEATTLEKAFNTYKKYLG